MANERRGSDPADDLLQGEQGLAPKASSGDTRRSKSSSGDTRRETQSSGDDR